MPEVTDHILDCADCYFHGVLSPTEKQYFDEHCAKCRICKVALEEAEKRAAALRSLPNQEPSPALIQTTLAKIDTHEKTHGRRFRILRRAVVIGLAASLLILGSLHLYFANLSASPYDLRIFGQNRLFAGSDASLRVQLLDHSRNLALHNVPVLIELLGQGRHIQLASFTTNEQGTFPARFRLPDWQAGDYELRVTAAPGGETHVISRTIKLQRSWKVMLSSDRPVYQPGQTIHVRGLALRGMDLKPVAGRDAVFTISDPKGNVIFKAKDVTSKFGIASADCPLATEIIEGTYTIHCQLDDTGSKLAVEVKKYVLPKFKIDLATEQPFYQPGQRVRGTVQAAYFFGKPVAGGTIELSLQSQEEKPLVQERLSLKTNDKGIAKFEFPPLPETLIGREQDAGDARIELEAVVTDTAGQKQSRTLSRLVAAQPLRIEVIPEAGTLVQEVPNTIYLFVTSADGQPVKSRVAVTGLDEELTTSELGVTSFEITPGAGEVTRTIRATDEQGRSARREATLRVGEANGDFLVRSDLAVYKGGDTMRLTALGSGSEPIFLDFIKDGQTILTETIAMKEGRGQLDFDLPPELFGTLQMCAYRFGEHGLPVRKTRVIYVHPPGDLHIETTLDRKEYRPGERARIEFRLTDKNGRPAPGALSLAAVDEAVFSVLEQRPGTERTFYGLENELLKPVYAIYPGWGSDGPQGKEVLDKALFSATVGRGYVDTRKALLRKLLPFLENSEYYLRRVEQILEQPDWEDLIEPDIIPDEFVPLLRNEAGTHSLHGVTHPANQRRTEARRLTALSIIRTVWIIFALVAGITTGILILDAFDRKCSFATKSLLILCWFGSFGLLAALLLPTIQKVRAASARVDAMNQLKQLGYAMHEAKSLKLPSMIEGSQIAEMTDVARPRLREYFPETLLWRPELITDNQGRASLTIDLADSITTWRLTSSAVTAGGKLGAAQTDIRVFQPFFVDVNLPVALTRGDEVSVPIVLYNYLDEPQRVTLRLDEPNWFSSADQAEQVVDLQPREVRSLSYRVRVTQVGVHDLQVTALGSGVADAVKRRIEVVPDGRRVEQVWNGQFNALTPGPSPGVPGEGGIDVPDDAIPGSARLFVKIYPSSFSQLVEGLDAIFQMPYGCFEQTSSTTYPNVLALDYLKRTGKSVPAVEAKARQYIHLGYQRLLGFEVAGGGFDWFGRPPANRTLTAYGVMEFTDMARVHDVDPNLIARTRKWLLEQRNADGS